MLSFRRKNQQPKETVQEGMSTVSKDKKTTSLTQSTVVSAPATVVWESLTDIVSWQWNRSVRLEASYVMEGATGKAKTVLGCSRVTSSFKFGKITRRNFTFTWITNLGSYECTSTIQLKPVGIKRTELIHTQTFKGKGIFFRVPIKKYQKAARVMNEGLKNHVESLYFNTLLYDFSNSEMIAPGFATSSTELTVLSEASSNNFWDTPKHIREKLVDCFVDRKIATDSEPVYDA